MILHVTKAEYRGGHKIWLSFNDGTSGLADLAGHLHGSVFEPLRDRRLFERFRVDPQLNTLVWDNGADLAPEYLRRLVQLSRKGRRKESLSPRTTGRRKSGASARPLRGTRRELSL